MWSVEFRSTITGDLLAVFMPHDILDAKWRRAMGKGNGSHVFSLRDRKKSLAVSSSLSVPNSTSIAVLWGRNVMYAGMISDDDYSFKSGQLSVEHLEGVRFHFRERMTFGIGSYNEAGGDLVVENRSVAGAIRAILKYGIGAEGRGGPEWQLPIDRPDDGAGSLNFHWRYHEKHKIDKLLGQIEGLGNEIDFEPYLDAGGKLRYRTRFGERITAGVMEFPVSVRKSLVRDLRVRRSGRDQKTGVLAIGKGSGVDQKVGQAGYLTDGPGIPVRDTTISEPDVDDVAQLDAIAMAELRRTQWPTTQWDFLLQNERSAGGWRINFGDLRVGTTLTLGVYGDPWIPDGQHNMRVVGFSGDTSYALKPEVVPA